MSASAVRYLVVLAVTWLLPHIFQVAVRSILLRGFDQQVAEKLGSVMKNIGVKFVRPAVPSKIEKVRTNVRSPCMLHPACVVVCV